MGVAFLFGYTTFCSTVVLFVYFSLTKTININIGYELYNSNLAELNQDINNVQCHPLNTTEILRKKLVLQIVHRFPIRTETLQFSVIPKLGKGYNNAKYRDDIQCIKTCPYQGKVVFVTNVIALNDYAHKSTLLYQSRSPTSHEINARWMEIMNTLQQNLRHRDIKTVAVLVEDYTVAEVLRKIDFDNSEKMIIQNANRMLRMPDSFEYATRCFKGEVIVVGNQDIIFGKGWNNLNVTYLEQNNVMYALTRHNSILNEFCYGNPNTGVCGRDYSWAHDAFVLHVKKHIDHKYFPSLKSKIFNVYGVENIVIWTFRKKLNYKVTNPCLILQLHHEHCVPIRNKRKQEGDKTIWATADFTDTLY